MRADLRCASFGNDFDYKWTAHVGLSFFTEWNADVMTGFQAALWGHEAEALNLNSQRNVVERVWVTRALPISSDSFYIRGKLILSRFSHNYFGFSVTHKPKPDR